MSSDGKTRTFYCEVGKEHFHDDWTWLMVVVKKCYESFEHHQYDSEEYHHITEEIFHPDYSLSEFMNADIEAVYKRVIEYIKWYNNKVKKDFYCQSQIEDRGKCSEQCEHCSIYYKPLEQIN